MGICSETSYKLATSDTVRKRGQPAERLRWAASRQKAAGGRRPAAPTEVTHPALGQRQQQLIIAPSCVGLHSALKSLAEAPPLPPALPSAAWMISWREANSRTAAAAAAAGLHQRVSLALALGPFSSSAHASPPGVAADSGDRATQPLRTAQSLREEALPPIGACLAGAGSGCAGHQSSSFHRGCP